MSIQAVYTGFFNGFDSRTLLQVNELRFSNILSKSGVLLFRKVLIYQGFFTLLIGGRHSKTLKMRND